LNVTKLNVLNHTFYVQDQLILPEYRHLKTPKSVRDSLEVVRTNAFTKSEIWFKSEEVQFVRDSFKHAQKPGKPGELVLPTSATSYFPNLGDLTEAQRNSYFNWRRNFLNDVPTRTNGYFLYIFIAELLNYTFNSSAAFNISVLTQIKRMFGHEQGLLKLLNRLIQDMLTEAGVDKTDSTQPNPVYLRLNGEPELYYALERYEDHIQNGTEPGKDSLAKISITTWKRHFDRPRKNQFFNVHRNKIYKTFKECLVVLDNAYRLQGSSLLETFFTTTQEERKIKLFADVPVYRKTTPESKKEVDMISYSKDMAPILRNYYRLSENVTRTLENEKRQLKLEEGILPEGLFEQMLEHMKPKPKIKVKKAPEPEPFIPVEVTFDDSKISRLQQETEALVQEVEERSLLEEEAPVMASPVKETSLTDFLAKGTEETPELQDFLTELTDLEIQFLQQFQDGILPKKSATAFLKSKGKMLGSALSQLNEKAQDYLEDNLIEEEGDNLIILEEFLALGGML